MKIIKKFDNLNYQQAQKRNSENFNSLSKLERLQARKQGYKNSSWNGVCQSWIVLQNFINKPVVDFARFAINKAEEKYEKARKNGDLLEVLKAGKTVIQALKLKYQ